VAFGGLRGTLTGFGTSIVTPETADGSVAVSIQDLIVVMVAEAAANTVTTVTDNLGQTYTAINAGTLSSVGLRGYYRYVTVAGTLTQVSCVMTSSSNDHAISVAVYEGPFTSTPLDRAPANTVDAATPYTCAATTVLSQANELIVAGLGLIRCQTATATSPNTLAINTLSAAANTNNACSSTIGYQVVAATTSVTPVFASSGTITGGVQIVATFRQGVIDTARAVSTATSTVTAGGNTGKRIVGSAAAVGAVDGRGSSDTSRSGSGTAVGTVAAEGLATADIYGVGSATAISVATATGSTVAGAYPLGLIARTSKTFPTPDGGTTDPIDTSGANFILLQTSENIAAGVFSVSDNKGNTWQFDNTVTNAASGPNLRLRVYSVSPFTGGGAKVGPNHTFTVTSVNSNVSIQVSAFRYAGTFSYGSIAVAQGALPHGTTPFFANAGDLIITGVGGTNNIFSVSSGFIASNLPVGESWGAAYAFYTTSSSGNVNPIWTGGVDGLATGNAAVITQALSGVWIDDNASVGTARATSTGYARSAPYPLGLIAQSNKAFPTADGGTTDPIDTSGANMLFLHFSHDVAVNFFTVSDNKGNNWLINTPISDAASGAVCRERTYNAALSGIKVGPGHTVTVLGAGGKIAIQFLAWRSSTGVGFDQLGVGQGALPHGGGPITQYFPDELIITSFSGASSPAGVEAGTTILNTIGPGANNYATSVAYFIRHSAGTLEPWWFGSGNAGVTTQGYIGTWLDANASVGTASATSSAVGVAPAAAADTGTGTASALGVASGVGLATTNTGVGTASATSTAIGVSPVAVSAMSHLVSAYTPGAPTNSFNGYFGFKFRTDTITEHRYNRMGIRAESGNTGLHTVGLHYFTGGDGTPIGTPIRGVDIDLTGSTAGNWYYAEIPEIILSDLTSYLVVASVVSGGQLWADSGPVTLIAGTTDVAAAYSPAGGPWSQSAVQNESYVGLDLGLTGTRLVAHAQGYGGQNGGATNSADTTGANLLVLHVTNFNIPTISDSKGNTWTVLGHTDNGSIRDYVYYVNSQTPNVGSGHSVTYSGLDTYCSAELLAFSIAGPWTFDEIQGATGANPVGASLTTDQANELVISTAAGDNPLLFTSVTGGLNIVASGAGVGAVNFTTASAYKVQPSLATVTATWTASGANQVATNIFAFKPYVAVTDTGVGTASAVSTATGISPAGTDVSGAGTAAAIANAAATGRTGQNRPGIAAAVGTATAGGSSDVRQPGSAASVALATGAASTGQVRQGIAAAVGTASAGSRSDVRQPGSAASVALAAGTTSTGQVRQGIAAATSTASASGRSDVGGQGLVAATGTATGASTSELHVSGAGAATAIGAAVASASTGLNRAGTATASSTATASGRSDATGQGLAAVVGQAASISATGQVRAGTATAVGTASASSRSDVARAGSAAATSEAVGLAAVGFSQGQADATAVALGVGRGDGVGQGAASALSASGAAGRADTVVVGAAVSVATVTGSATFQIDHSGSGSAAAVSTATASGRSDIPAVGAAFGLGAAVGASSSQLDLFAVGAAAGLGTAGATGRADAVVAGLAAAVATVTGASTSSLDAYGAGAATGAGIAAATGRGDGIAVGAVLAAGTATATGRGDGVATGSAVATSNAASLADVGYSEGHAAAVGVAAATGRGDGTAVGAVLAASAATATGRGDGVATGSAVAIGSGTGLADVGYSEGNAAATSAATATGRSDSRVAGLAAGTGVAAATGQGDGTGTAASVATSTTQSTGRSDAIPIGSATGVATVVASSRTDVRSAGDAVGISVAIGSGRLDVRSDGVALGTGFGRAVVLVIGSGIATSTATAAGRSDARSDGIAAGTAVGIAAGVLDVGSVAISAAHGQGVSFSVEPGSIVKTIDLRGYLPVPISLVGQYNPEVTLKGNLPAVTKLTGERDNVISLTGNRTAKVDLTGNIGE